MANPFLMMDDEVEDASNNDVSNPFLMQDTQGDDESYPVDNPFAPQPNNPFAFGNDDDANATVDSAADHHQNQQSSTGKFMSTHIVNSFQPIDSAMSFFGTTIEADDDPTLFDSKPAHLSQVDDCNAAYSSEEELSRKKGPKRPSLPPSQTTQDLIYAVSDQLDQASSHLLGRLPATRTPSPVSMRDIHSPSPTPEVGLADLLDMDSTGEHVDFTASNDNPFGVPTAIPNMRAVSPPQHPVRPQPPRPAPPRPTPPRPTPPVVPLPSIQSAPPQQIIQQQQQQEPDLFDMFGETPVAPPKPPAPKTKEDILSLFTAPKQIQQQQQPQQIDFLSGDILLDNPSDISLPPPLTEAIPQPQIIPQTTTATVSSPEKAAAAVPNAVAVTQNEHVQETQPQPQPEPETQAQPQTKPKPQSQSEQITPEETQSQTQAVRPPPPRPPPARPLPPPQPVTTVTEPQISPTKENVLDQATPAGEEPALPDQAAMASIGTPEVPYKRAPTPDIEVTECEDNPRSDDEIEPEIEKPELEKASSVESVPTESNVTAQAIPGSPTEATANEQSSELEQMDTGLDFAPSIPSGQVSANPFASPEDEPYPISQAQTNIFAADETSSSINNIFSAQEQPVYRATSIFAVEQVPVGQTQTTDVGNIFGLNENPNDEFDAFAAKFDSVKKDDVSLLDGFGGTTPIATPGDAWGESDGFGTVINTGTDDGFGGDEGFDSFLAMKAPEPTISRRDSMDSLNDDEKEFSVVIRPKDPEHAQGVAPILAPPPPPRGGSQNNSIYSGDSSPRFNPFDKGDEAASAEGVPATPEPAAMKRTDSQETPQTPLFDEDVSQPLEDFPRITYTGPGWEVQLRQPNKKKITGQRFWKKIFIKLSYQGDNPVLQLYNLEKDKEPFQELPLQPCYSVSDIGAQQYDQFGKIFTIKLQYIFYKERPGVRPGQVTKAERLTNKLSQFAAYAIQGDYQGVKEFGSDLKKLGLPVEHAPQVSQLFKIGSMNYEDMKQFSVCVEEALFKLSAHRDRALTYKSEEVQITAVDELYVEQDAEGHVHKQIARVRLFFLGFLSGMPSVELGANDLWRQGKEVVGRHDIIPVVTEEWIRLEGVEFHNTVQQDEYERTRTIKFQPPDACYIELMRFRVRPPKNRELPLQCKATWVVTGNRVELRADVLVPGFASRKLGQIPCEDVAIRFPIPECWIYLFRVEKHFRYGSVKSAHRRTGKIKGIERILGTVDQLQESLIEVTSGQAKYEHHHRAIVWRCPRLPKEGQGAYTTHQMICRMALTSYDQIPEQLAPYCYVEFTMPATQVSHTTVRSVSIQDSDSDEPPEKYVRYLARHEYRVGIEHTTGESPNAYLAATRTTTIKEEAPVQPATSPMAPSDSDSDSN